MADKEGEIKSACTAAILALFPDISPDYLEKTAANLRYDHDAVINEILGNGNEAKAYPRKPRSNVLKRKRDASKGANQLSQAQNAYDSAIRPRESSMVYVMLAKQLLAQDFPRAKVKSITRLFEENKNLLWPSYLALDQIDRDWKEGKPLNGFEMKKTRTVAMSEYHPTALDRTIREAAAVSDRKRVLEELRAVRLVRNAEDAKRQLALRKEREEEENLAWAQANGTAVECGCCFGDFAMNRMVCCSNSGNEHYFCLDCARRNAETAVGLQKFELDCMSMDGCSAGFSQAQRSKFLDDKLLAALDRIEFITVLRLAGVKNLETCPFCPFAAEYPPVEENKEFTCANAECEMISCRLCREETHIPKTCVEAAREQGQSARHMIEEAMSAALIRKCNKCNAPFIKESGCNKMTCTAAGCGNVQCYVCSKSCSYDHFDDASRGGKKGNCPLFEDVVVRHDTEVKEAEKWTRQKIMEENPKFDEELLAIGSIQRTQKKQDNMQLPHKRAPKVRLRAPQHMPHQRDGPPQPPNLPVMKANNALGGQGGLLAPANNHAQEEADGIRPHLHLPPNRPVGNAPPRDVAEEMARNNRWNEEMRRLEAQLGWGHLATQALGPSQANPPMPIQMPMAPGAGLNVGHPRFNPDVPWPMQIPRLAREDAQPGANSNNPWELD